MFARPWQIPVKWLKDQHKLAQLPNFTDAMLGSLRSAVGLAGQRELLLYRLDRLRVSTLIVWVSRTGCFLTSRRKTRSPLCKTAPSNSSLTVATCLTSSNPSGSYLFSTGFSVGTLSKRAKRHLYSPSCREVGFSSAHTYALAFSGFWNRPSVPSSFGIESR
jgi:hypothetical protein